MGITLIHSDHKMVEKCKMELDEDLNVDSIKGDCSIEWEDFQEGDYRDIYLSKKTFNTPDGIKYRLLIEALNIYEYPYEEKDGEVITEWMISLNVVPVSVSDKTILICLGCGEEGSGIWEWTQEDKKKNGDYRSVVEDIHKYGLNVQIWCESVFSGEEKKELLELVNEAKKQAAPVPSLFGFYMDKPINAVGWTGWTVFTQAEAYPGQSIDTSDKGEETKKCDDCWEEDKVCKPFKTIYEDEHWVCESCLHTWVDCKECGILIPVAPQSWSGVDWVEIAHQKYCGNCAQKLIDDGKFQYIKGGTELKPEDIRKITVNLVPVGDYDGDCFKNWERVNRWDIRCDQDGDQEIDFITKEVKDNPNYNYMVGYVGIEQFGMNIGLYRSPTQISVRK